MKATGDTGTLQRLVASVSAADGHETGHLNLGELNLAAPEGSQGLDGQQWVRVNEGGMLTMSATLNF